MCTLARYRLTSLWFYLTGAHTHMRAHTHAHTHTHTHTHAHTRYCLAAHWFHSVHTLQRFYRTRMFRITVMCASARYHFTALWFHLVHYEDPTVSRCAGTLLLCVLQQESAQLYFDFTLYSREMSQNCLTSIWFTLHDTKIPQCPELQDHCGWYLRYLSRVSPTFTLILSSRYEGSASQGHPGRLLCVAWLGITCFQTTYKPNSR